MEKIIQKIKNQIKNEKIIVACSTGPDSMALLSLCEKALDKSQIIVCHVNHKHRAQSEEEEKYMISYAEEHGLKLCVTHINVPSTNFEEEARNLRLKFFFECMDKYDAKYLLTAHHGEDNIETILMRIMKKSSLKGYSGMRELSVYNGKIMYKPLLSLNKEELISYLNDEDIKFYIDHTNLSDDHLRNRIRKNIIPLLKEENPRLIEAFNYFSDEVYEASLLLDQRIIEYTNLFCIKEEDTITFDLENLVKLDPFIYKEVIYQNLRKYELSVKNMDEVMKIVESPKSKVVRNITKSLNLIKEYGKLIFTTKSIEYKPLNIVLDKEGKYLIFDDLYITIKENDCNLRDKKYNIWYNNISLPLIITNREDGDKIRKTKKGKPYMQKVNDILTNEKVPYLERINIYKIVSSNEIIGLTNYKKIN